MKQLIFLASACCGLFLWIFSSCGGAFLNTSSFFSSLPDVEGGSRNIPNNEFFYINISDATYRGRHGFDLLDYEMYERENGPGYDCKISINEEASTEDMYCMFEILEGDLFFHELDFEYNAPPGMCHYVFFQTHWHYNQESGYGPRKVYEEKCYPENSVSRYCEKGESGGLCSDSGRYGSCQENQNTPTGTKYCASSVSTTPEELCTHNRYSTCQDSTGQNLVSRACYTTDQPKLNSINCYEEEASRYCTSRVATQGECDASAYNGCEEEVNDLCKYIRTEGENCCLGEYTQISTSEDGSPTTTEGSWGGSLTQCIGGLGRTAWENYTEDGLPRVLIVEALDGLREQYEIPPLIDISGGNTRSGFVTANYWEGIEDRTDEPEFYKSSPNPPPAHQPVPREGYPYITFACKDQAYEVKHRIHLVIREWNSQEEFRDFKDSQGSSGDPDAAGEAGSDCDYYEQDDDYELEDRSCNDIVDVDDWTGVAGSGGCRILSLLGLGQLESECKDQGLDNITIPDHPELEYSQ